MKACQARLMAPALGGTLIRPGGNTCMHKVSPSNGRESTLGVMKTRRLHPLSLKMGCLIRSQVGYVVLILCALAVDRLQYGK